MRPAGSARSADDDTEIDLIAQAAVNVLVTTTEAGDRIAWARRIHDRRAGGGRPFVAVSSDAAPTMDGAQCVDRWFRRAAGGTLFIDQVGDLSATAQGRLLSLLDRQSRRHDRATRADAGSRVRIVSGSNRSLRADVAVGSFSDTLFYRLNLIHVDLSHQDDVGEPAMKARDIMSAPAYTCGPDTDLATVARIMWDHDCGFVPVVDASGTVTGVVTDRDICIATSTRRVLPEHMSAAQAMASPIHACLADESVSDVLATMKQFRIRRVPVIDGHGRLQGVISLNDLVLASNATREPQASDIVSTMAAICAHQPLEAALA